MEILVNQHKAIFMPDGKVLTIGGSRPGRTLPNVLIFDPATNAWTPALDLTQARVGHTATLLENGVIVVLGGETGGLVGGGGVLSNAEMYDTASGSWLQQAPQ